jgi:hypothetical protein
VLSESSPDRQSANRGQSLTLGRARRADERGICCLAVSEAEPLEIRCESRGDVVGVALQGELDLATVEQVRAVLSSRAPRAATVILDLRGLTSTPYWSNEPAGSGRRARWGRGGSRRRGCTGVRCAPSRGWLTAGRQGRQSVIQRSRRSRLHVR